MTKQVHDFTEVVEALCALFGRFAIPHRDVKPRRHNVEVRKGKGEKDGHLLFRFFTRDRFLIEMDVDMADVVRDPRRYMNDTMGALVANIQDMRKRRQGAGGIVTLDTPANRLLADLGVQ